ncbi:MAG: 5-oxoprolinase subunit PxpB [Chitinophagaceae bacterium]
MKNNWTFYPCGEAALTLQWGDEAYSREASQRILQLAAELRHHPFHGYHDGVVAYHTLTVHYDPFLLHTHYKPSTRCQDWVKSHLEKLIRQSSRADLDQARHHHIPVYYTSDPGSDLFALSLTLSRTPEELIRLHCAPIYNIYMVGFLPGFPYLGTLPPELVVPRKSKPVLVQPGSVAIAGRQTGIYPLASPGGWHVLGQTPIQIFQPEAKIPVLVQAGDTVSFIPITKKEFDQHIRLRNGNTNS